MKRTLSFFVCLCLTIPCQTIPAFVPMSLAQTALAQSGVPQREEFPAAAESFVAEYFAKLGELFRQSAERAAPAVVSIRVTRTQPVGRNQPARMSEESGTGIVVTIAQKQVILTNRHVIEETERGAIEILTHNRRLLTLVNIASNEDFDIAVLEVTGELPESARLGNSNQVHVGEVVLAVGNPFGLDRSVSMGIISAVGRRNVPGASGSAPRTGFFQTDAAVNPGSSGGMLLNLRGEVIGILTAIATQGGRNEGVAFAMPINAVLRIAEQLVESGMVVKPYIGFGFESSISSEERQKLGIDRVIGAKIRTVEPDSPADQAGLQMGDVVLTFADTEVEDGLHVIHLVAQSEIDKPAALRVNRNGEILHLTVTPTAQLSR